jgi:hypothetical protein
MADASAKAALLQAVRTAIEATSNDADAAGELISHYVLPICLERPALRISLQIANPHDFREYLSRWIEQYADGQRVPLRTRIPGETLEALRSEPSRPAIWTISAIGLGSPAVEAALLSLINRRDDIGNAAIGCLAALGPVETIRDALVNTALRRLVKGSLQSVGFALQELASPGLIPALARRERGDSFDQMLLVGYLGRIAAREPNNRRLQSKVWSVLRKWINEKGRYRAFISDIAGQDIRAHGGEPERGIREVRDWLRTASKRNTLPGATEIVEHYRQFRLDLPRLCTDLKLEPDRLTFPELATLITDWLKNSR